VLVASGKAVSVKLCHRIIAYALARGWHGCAHQ